MWVRNLQNRCSREAMKTCSKCRQDQPLEMFVKSPNYSDGLYPLCKSCRKEGRLKWLINNPLCSRCKQRPHRKGCGWCEECRHQAGNHKWYRNANGNGTLCPRCGVNQRLQYHRYCSSCQKASQKKWRQGKGRTRSAIARTKKTARHYINVRIRRGKMKRLPCVICGCSPTEFHHLSYHARSTTGQFLCKLHHWMAHHFERKFLTVFAKLW